MRRRHPEHDPLAAALWVSWLTVGWSTATGVAAAVVGILTGSLSLAGLGLTVLLDVGSSIVLIWRFRHERAGGRAVDRAERLAHRVASVALIVFGVALAVPAVRDLVRHQRPTTTAVGVVLAAAGVVVLPLLARAKHRAADAVGSAALHADAHLTSVAAGIAAVTVAGLGLVALAGWWWADATAALVLAVVAGRQGARGLAAAP